MFKNWFRNPNQGKGGSSPNNRAGKGKGPGKPKGAAAPRAKKGAASSASPKGLSPDQKLDIVGILLILSGVLILLGLFSPTHSAPVGAAIRLLGQLFGAGRFLAPAGLIAFGLWIVLRHFGDKLPRLAPERAAGWMLLFVVALVSIHFFLAETPEQALQLAEAGRGGGYLGAVLLNTFIVGLGTAGAVVIVLAGWIIAVILGAGITTQQLIAAAQKIGGSLRERMRRAEPAGQPARPRPAPNPPESTPAPQPPSPPPAAAAAKPEPHAGAAPKRPQQAGPSQPPAPGAAGPAAPPPAPPLYDQPIIIGGPQPWELPAVADMLEQGLESSADDQFDRDRVRVIEDTLGSFGAPARVVEVNRGPVITQFGVEPEFVEVRGKKTKVKVSKIASLADDLALALAAPSIRIEAPVPGKGYVGIEVPNTEINIVALRDVMDSEAFGKVRDNTSLALALGQDVSGQAVCADLTNMPHLLIAGTTGSGKSVCVNAIIACLLLQNTPDDIKLLMVDPKRVELTSYNGIPHLLAPVVVDLERVVNSLQWVTREMDERYHKFARAGTRNISDYNNRLGKDGGQKLPYLIVIIDELADLMMLAPDETERTVTRLAQMSRATGIHLIIATQRPSVDVVTGLIKANFPARVAFAVASSVDSRVVLDQPGAEKLLGRGDMLFQSPDAAQPLRMQGVFVSDAEIQRIVRYWKGARGLDEAAVGAEAAAAPSAAGLPRGKQPPLWEELREAELKAEGEDDLYGEAVQVVREMRKASITLLQRRLRIGYTRAARLIDLMEERGIVGPAKSGAQQREVLGLDDLDPTRPAPAPTPTRPNTRTWEKDQ